MVFEFKLFLSPIFLVLPDQWSTFFFSWCSTLSLLGCISSRKSTYSTVYKNIPITSRWLSPFGKESICNDDKKWKRAAKQRMLFTQVQCRIYNSIVTMSTRQECASYRIYLQEDEGRRNQIVSSWPKKTTRKWKKQAEKIHNNFLFCFI